MAYVDGFVLAVPKDKLDEYRKITELAGSIWMEFGATSYVECVADDVPYGELTSFPRAVQAKDDEIVIFSWITYPSKEKRDEIDDKQLLRVEAIINSMTLRERKNHQVLNGSRRKRIARGSGTSVEEVNRLLKQFVEMRKMLKTMSSLGTGRKGRQRLMQMMRGAR